MALVVSYRVLHFYQYGSGLKYLQFLHQLAYRRICGYHHLLYLIYAGSSKERP